MDQEKQSQSNNFQEQQKAEQSFVFERADFGRVLLHNGKTYLSAGSIAKEFGYALSHVSLLARHKRIEAVWTGKRWFVNRDSILQYRGGLTGRGPKLPPILWTNF